MIEIIQGWWAIAQFAFLSYLALLAFMGIAICATQLAVIVRGHAPPCTCGKEDES